MNLVTDKACFNLELREASRLIAIFALVMVLIGAIFSPNYFTTGSTLVGFIFHIIGNVALLFGAQLNNQWLVLVWLFQAVYYIIQWPIAVLGVIFNFGNYRYTAFFSNIFLILIEYVISLVIFLFLARIVYSYWHQLRNSQSNPQHSVVV